MPIYKLINRQSAKVNNHVRPAAQLKSKPAFSAKFLSKLSLLNTITSKKMTARIRIRTKPQRATKSSNLITKAGKQAAMEVTKPVKSVTFQRFQSGVTDWKASPALYIVGFAVD